MDYSILEKSTLFQGVEANVLRGYLEETPHHIQCYDKEETIFHLMDPALRIGIILEGRVEAQKSFPNGSQVNVSIRIPGEIIGPAAVFSKSQRYPCDIVALEPATLMMLRKEDLLSLMQKDVKILQNFTTEIASATYMLTDPGLHVQMGNDHECIKALSSSGNEEAGRRRHHTVRKEKHLCSGSGRAPGSTQRIGL